MFCRDITSSDAFTEMALSAQALYFHLGLAADVSGFVTPKGTMRLINANVDDLKTLIAKQFVIPFDSGVVVITHWNMHNNIREDREAKTIYQKELKQLETKEGEYLLQENSRSTPAQIRLDEIRLDEISIADKKSAHSEIMKFYSDLVNSKFGFKPKIDAADGKLLKSALAMGLPDLKALIDWYLNSDKCRELENVSLSSCLSKDSINKWRLTENKPKQPAFTKI